jgi:hypothetical protein
MIRIRAIDRIELVRGPASVCTERTRSWGAADQHRRGGDIRGGSVTGRVGVSTSTHDAPGNLAPQASGSLDSVVGTREGDLSILLSGRSRA